MAPALLGRAPKKSSNLKLDPTQFSCYCLPMNFWQKLKKKKGKKPILVLAPMADVTDSAFRAIIAKYGKPDVLWTEFVSADGLCSIGKKKLMPMLKFSVKEKPIIAQLFGSNPVNMKKASVMVAKLGFSGIDINMGCPDRKIEKQNSGSAHIKNPTLAREIIRSVKEGVLKSGKNIPVSVKTRIGYNKNELETWLPQILLENPALVTIHARTRKEMSDVPARWEHIKQAVEIRDQLKSDALIFGNGDIRNISEAKIKAKETGADGVMIGRGIFGNPFLFSDKYPKKPLDLKNKKDRDFIIKKLKVLMEHSFLFEKLLGKSKNFAVMKKHFKAYVSNWDGAKELRVLLMNTNNSKEVKLIISKYIASLR